jgi:glyoxylase-like metal-dependent hydrolase (beta-lactamase superfamily II)/8-oxo-dGTP pyrophosphatase MutT (NUDIX family)
MSSSGRQDVQTAGCALVRTDDRQLEVLLARRPDGRGFLPGFHGFVVGRVRETDDDVPMEPAGPKRAPSVPHWGCAVREMFEELGILPLTDGWVRTWSDAPGLEAPAADWSAFRTRVQDDEIDFAGALRGAGLTVDASPFHPVGCWSTPSWADFETTTEFFAVEAPVVGERLLEAVDRLEHLEPVWVPPGEAVRRWEENEWFLSTPIRLVLEGLAEMQAVRDRDLLPTRQRQTGVTREMIEVLGGLRMLPLSTPTLPPATHTNSYIVGRQGAVLVDPGSGISREQAMLEELLDDLDAGDCPLETVVLTHHHEDHVGGLRAVVERWNPEVAAHPETASRLGVNVEVDRMLEEGERIDVASGDEHALEVYHTPGHAPGHICLGHEPSGCLLAGDLVASKGTILIDPPEGKMGPYLESLERMRSLDPTALLPAHGTVVSDPEVHLSNYLSHRRERERKVLRALERAGEPVSPRELVEEVYADAPTAAWPLAVRSLEAHLLHLVERSRASRRDGRFVYESSSSSTKS